MFGHFTIQPDCFLAFVDHRLMVVEGQCLFLAFDGLVIDLAVTDQPRPQWRIDPVTFLLGQVGIDLNQAVRRSANKPTVIEVRILLGLPPGLLSPDLFDRRRMRPAPYKYCIRHN